MREIGGYMELERFRGDLYHGDAVALNCGRGCLAYLVELRGISAMWVPDWMCSSVTDLLVREGVAVKLYRVGCNMLPVYDFDVGEGEWMLLMDYYGQLRHEDVGRALAHSGGRLAVDETQGFFRQPWSGVDTLYTCRKWFGVADGGYLATRDGAHLDRKLPRDESRTRMGFVLGRLERTAGEFFAEAGENNDAFASEPAKVMSPVTEDLLRAVDYQDVAERRRANWRMLHASLGTSNGLAPSESEVPFMYPYMTDGAQRVRRNLIEGKIFVPMLWPDLPDGLPRGSVAREMSESILPLPVDQRYGREEMGRILEVLSECTS